MSEAKKILAQALKVSTDDISDDAAIGRTERWDSLAHMQLILALEESLGRVLDTDAMLAIESLADIEALVS